MALPPPGPFYPPMPPEIAALLNKGHYAEGFKKGATDVGKQILKKGPRIVKPIAEIARTGLRAAGMFAEAEEVFFAGEAIALSPEAAALAASARLMAGWESVVGCAAVVAESPIIVPLLVVGLGLAFLWAVNNLPKPSQPAISREYQNLNLDVKCPYPVVPSIYRLQPGRIG